MLSAKNKETHSLPKAAIPKSPPITTKQSLEETTNQLSIASQQKYPSSPRIKTQNHSKIPPESNQSTSRFSGQDSQKRSRLSNPGIAGSSQIQIQNSPERAIKLENSSRNSFETGQKMNTVSNETQKTIESIEIGSVRHSNSRSIPSEASPYGFKGRASASRASDSSDQVKSLIRDSVTVQSVEVDEEFCVRKTTNSGCRKIENQRPKASGKYSIRHLGSMGMTESDVSEKRDFKSLGIDEDTLMSIEMGELIRNEPKSHKNAENILDSAENYEILNFHQRVGAKLSNFNEKPPNRKAQREEILQKTRNDLKMNQEVSIPLEHINSVQRNGCIDDLPGMESPLEARQSHSETKGSPLVDTDAIFHRFESCPNGKQRRMDHMLVVSHPFLKKSQVQQPSRPQSEKREVLSKEEEQMRSTMKKYHQILSRFEVFLSQPELL